MKNAANSHMMAVLIMWAAALPGSALYAAASCDGLADTPTNMLGNSSACLSCHDGTVAGNAMPLPLSETNYDQHFGHPVQVSYEQAYARQPRVYVAPGALDARLQLVDGKVQCVTCHTTSESGIWVKVSLDNRDLCLGCHLK
jgi:predicted CXXCH cytochrome family protein